MTTTRSIIAKIRPGMEDRRCPYEPFNARRCSRVGTIDVVGSVSRTQTRVCAEHLAHYTSNGWVRA